jgi:hypothetical protein
METIRHAALGSSSVRIIWTRGDAGGAPASRLVVMVEPLRKRRPTEGAPGQRARPAVGA